MLCHGIALPSSEVVSGGTYTTFARLSKDPKIKFQKARPVDPEKCKRSSEARNSGQSALGRRQVATRIGAHLQHDYAAGIEVIATADDFEFAELDRLLEGIPGLQLTDPNDDMLIGGFPA